jgi:fibronectin type 3 domain-containing protein
LPIQNKSIIELFEPIFGRMNATLGVELPFTSALNQTAIPLAYIDPATESIGVGETQIWKITHNGVDSHPVHFHLVNMQILNRIGWDGTVKPPLGNELGWKETVQMNPLEDIIVAVRAKKPMTPFGLPQSVRMLDPTQPVDATLGFTQVNIANNTPLTVKNRLENYDNEYVWHCHILGHEENDFMRPFVFHPNDATPNAPGNVVVSNGALTWTDPTPVGAPGTLGNAQNEIGFRVERTEGVASATSVWARAGNALANATSFTDAGAIAGTNYSYRVFAYNSKGDSLPSSEANLTAVPLAPTEFFAVANALGMPTLVSMTWTDNAINETGYQVLRNGAVIANLPANNSAVPTTMTYSDSTALPSTLYTYTVQAVNGAGVSPAIAPVSVTTPVSVVANPGALAAVVTPIGVSPMTVSLSWANLAAATSYQLTRNGTVVANLSPGATNFIDASVAETTTYTYVLTAFNTAGATALPAVTVTTPIGLPLAPTSFVATANALGQPTQVSLTWVDNATNETAYEIFRNAVLLTNLPAGSSSYIDTTALPVRTYSYQVVAIDPAGRGASATLTVRTPVGLAAAATGLTAKATAVGVFPMAVTLNWTDNANNETSYQVIRNGILITTLGANVTTYLDQAVAGSTAYTYVITAVNTAAAVPSAPVSVTTPVGLPLAPTLLRATSTAIPQQVNLTWVDNATNETSYQVLRNNILIATLPAGSTSYSDTTVTELTTYTYQVVAVDPAGTASSGLVQVTTVSAVLAPTNLTITESTGLQATLRWTDNATNETRYRILRAPVVAGVVGTYAQIGNIAANSTTYVDPTVLVIGNDYSYQVIAVRTAPVTNVVTLSAPATATINIALLVPVAPSALTATPNSAARVTLNWADNANNETSYKVERAVVTGGVIGTYAVLNAALPLNTRTFVDNSAAAGNIYSYRVSAGNAAGSSPAALVTANMTAYAVAPTNLTAVASATRRATLTWADNATNETGYRVERALVTGTTVGAYATVANLAVNVTTYADPTALLALRTYSYRVTAVTAVAANNSASVTVSVTMP